MKLYVNATNYNLIQSLPDWIIKGRLLERILGLDDRLDSVLAPEGQSRRGRHGLYNAILTNALPPLIHDLKELLP